MWGENWGEMIWGGLTPAIAQVPFSNPWLLIGFAIYTIGAVLATHRFGAKRVAPFIIVLIAPLFAVAVPNIFINGDIADAEQVNENFADIETKIDETKIVLTATAGTHPTFQPINHRAFLDLCGDISGCNIRFCSDTSSIVQPECYFSLNLIYRQADSFWKLRGLDTNGSQYFRNGNDNNSVTDQLLATAGSCFLTDDDSDGVRDNTPGFSLSTPANIPITINCELTITD